MVIWGILMFRLLPCILRFPATFATHINRTICFLSQIKGFSPIIIIGAHRSGTSLLTRILENMGVFVGSQLDSNHESLFFLDLNKWFMNQSGARWDNPEPVQDFLVSNPANLDLVERYVKFIMKSPQAYRYLGLGKYLYYGDIAKINAPWGWKDPRNTFLLPFWLRLFPEAKVIHIFRHGVDVANSLYVRTQKYREKWTSRYDRIKWLYALKMRRHGFTDSLRFHKIDNAFSLWENYIEVSQNHANNLGDQAFTIRYESLLNNPQKILIDLVEFLELNLNDKQVDCAAEKIRPDRAHAYEIDPKLQKLCNLYSNRLAKYGY